MEGTITNTENTFITIQPHEGRGVLVEETTKCLEQKGFCLVSLKLMQASDTSSRVTTVT